MNGIGSCSASDNPITTIFAGDPRGVKMYPPTLTANTSAKGIVGDKCIRLSAIGASTADTGRLSKKAESIAGIQIRNTVANDGSSPTMAPIPSPIRSIIPVMLNAPTSPNSPTRKKTVGQPTLFRNSFALS